MALVLRPEGGSGFRTPPVYRAVWGTSVLGFPRPALPRLGAAMAGPHARQR